MDTSKAGPSLGQIKEKIGEAIETVAAGQTLRAISEPPTPAQPPGENLGASLTKTIFETQAATNKLLADERKAEAEARTAAERDLHQTRLETLKDQEQRLITMGNKATSSTSQGGLLEEVTGVIGVLKEVGKQFGWGPPPEPKGDAVPASIALQIQQMKQDHELAIEGLRGDRQEHQNSFLLEMKKWEEDKALRWAELKQKDESRRHLTEHLGNALADLSKRLESGESVEGTPPKQAPKATTMAIELDETSCPTCHEPLLVPKGATAIGCPKCQTAGKLRVPDAEASPQPGQP